MRLFCAAALSLVCGLWLAFADDKNPAQLKAERTARLADLKKKYDETFKELEEKHNKAPKAERRAIVLEMREETQLIVDKVLVVAEGGPKDEVGFEASAFAVHIAGKVGVDSKEVVKALDILTEHHAADPKVKDTLLYAMLVGKPGEKLLKAVVEKGADTDTKAVALALRGYLAAQAVDDSDEDRKIVAAVKAATDLLESAAKMAPNAKIDDTTVAKFTSDEIAGLKKITAMLPGNPAPKAESKTLDDKKVTLDDYKGKVVLLDFWHTRCPPCKAMIPHQRATAAKYSGKPFVLVSASEDPDKKTLEAFLQKESMPWVHWWDAGFTAQKAYRVWATPTLYLIDHEGVIRFRAIGEHDEKALDKLIGELVAAAEKAKG